MNWIEELQKRRRAIIGGVLILSLGSLFLVLLRNPISYDAFWHLQMGRDWIENGLSPWIDHYSFTFNGHPIHNPPVIFQALLHFSVSQFGLRTGFVLVKLFAYVVIIGSVLLALRRWKAHAILYAMVVPVIVFLLQLRSLLRPELMSYAFSILALILYFRAENKISTRNVLPMVALLLFWTNYHSSVVGYVIFFGFFLDCAVLQINTRAKPDTWVRWSLWGVLIFAVGFLNHDFSHPLIEALLFPDDWKILILEYLPPATSMKSLVGIYPVIVVAMLTPVLALQQRRFGPLVIWTVLAWQALLINRMVAPSGIVITMMAAHLLTRTGFPDKYRVYGPGFTKITSGFCVLFAGIALYSNIALALNLTDERRKPERRYPETLADYMIKEQVHGRIFNTYETGGYLIYRLSPHSQVYIDGRTQILYPVEHLQKFERARKSPEVLRHELDQYDVDLIVMSYSQYFHDLVTQAGGFGLDFIDSYLALYRRDSSNFMTLGRLMLMPACWKPEMLDSLREERERASQILPANSGVVPYADFVLGFTRAGDGREFMDKSFEESDWSDDIRRFAAYRFLESGDFDEARAILGGLSAQLPADFLAAALAMILSENYELATSVLSDFSSRQWVWINSRHQFIAYQLYQALAEHRQLTPGEQKYFEELNVLIRESGLPVPDADLNVAQFCF